MRHGVLNALDLCDSSTLFGCRFWYHRYILFLQRAYYFLRFHATLDAMKQQRFLRVLISNKSLRQLGDLKSLLIDAILFLDAD